jgi:hypothetical protein
MEAIKCHNFWFNIHHWAGGELDGHLIFLPQIETWERIGQSIIFPHPKKNKESSGHPISTLHHMGRKGTEQLLDSLHSP